MDARKFEMKKNKKKVNEKGEEKNENLKDVRRKHSRVKIN